MKISEVNSAQSQLAVDGYDPGVFAGLPKFHEAKTLLKERYNHIGHIGHPFVKHQVQDSFGLNLLHKHFDMSNDELLYRSFNDTETVATMQPMSVMLAEDAVPYLWRATRAGGTWRFVPLEFVRRSDVVRGTPTNLDGQQEFLSDFADRLAEFGVVDLFGLATLNIFRIPIGHDDLLVETTDTVQRKLTVRAEPRADQPPEELTETLWTFTPDDEELLGGGPGHVAAAREPDMICKGMHCNGHCKAHCIAHCQGHCKHPPKVKP